MPSSIWRHSGFAGLAPRLASVSSPPLAVPLLSLPARDLLRLLVWRHRCGLFSGAAISQGEPPKGGASRAEPSWALLEAGDSRPPLKSHRSYLGDKAIRARSPLTKGSSPPGAAGASAGAFAAHPVAASSKSHTFHTSARISHFKKALAAPAPPGMTVAQRLVSRPASQPSV